MGLFYLLSRLTMVSLGTLYPIFLSYKAIKSNDLPLLETLLMYWVVMGTVSAAEGTIEWIVSWIPFYYEIKTLALIWLTLPQIQGSTWVYVTYIHPFLLEHEQEIDATMARVKEQLKAAGMGYIKSGLEKLREAAMGSVTQSVLADVGTTENVTPAQRPPGYAVQLLRQYGPAAFAAGSALLRPMDGRGAVPAPPPDAVSTDAPSRAGGGPAAMARSTQAQVSSFVQREMRRRRTDGTATGDTTPEEPRGNGSPGGSGGGGVGFEEIQRDEASETEAEHARASAPAGRWWGWAGRPSDDVN